MSGPRGGGETAPTGQPRLLTTFLHALSRFRTHMGAWGSGQAGRRLTNLPALPASAPHSTTLGRLPWLPATSQTRMEDRPRRSCVGLWVAKRPSPDCLGASGADHGGWWRTAGVRREKTMTGIRRLLLD